MPLEITSINIERSNHLERIKAFLKSRTTDVLLLQELCARDIPFFEDLMMGSLIFTPQRWHPEGGMEPNGLGIVTRLPVTDVRIVDYFGNDANRPIEAGHHEEKIIFTSVTQGDETFRLATTHINVTEKGSVTETQRTSVTHLIQVADAEAKRAGGLLLTGDTNAPRGRESFDRLAAHFIDGVPAHYPTSIDGNLHRDGPIPFMVDALFHTANYRLENAALHAGVSDHMACTTTLYKAT